jgi:23S rRNA (guanosine2251-2'-O)-methyltransferase
VSGANRGGGGGGGGGGGARPPRGGFTPRDNYKPRDGAAGGTFKPRDAGGYKPREAAPRAAVPRAAALRDEQAPRSEPIQGDGERVIYGANPVREVLSKRPQSLRSIWVDRMRAEKSASDPVAQLVATARAAGIRVEERERTILDRASDDGRHQGVVAWLGAFHYTPLDKLVTGDEPALLVMLDGVEDPRNLGAILRSAYLLGAHGVIIPEHRAAQVTSLVSKASAGASELLPIAQVGNLVRALEELREMNLWRVAVHATEHAQPIAKIDGKMPLVLVLGGEGDGVRPLVAKNCDFHAVIPMQRAGVGSFNVSVAAALALYELRRQRSI